MRLWTGVRAAMTRVAHAPTETNGVDPQGSPFTARVVFTACTAPAARPGFTG